MFIEAHMIAKIAGNDNTGTLAVKKNCSNVVIRGITIAIGKITQTSVGQRSYWQASFCFKSIS